MDYIPHQEEGPGLLSLICCFPAQNITDFFFKGLGQYFAKNKMVRTFSSDSHDFAMLW